MSTIPIDSRRFFRPCTISRRIPISQIGRLEVLTVMMGKCIMVLCSVCVAGALVVGSAHTYRDVYGPKMTVSPAVLAEAQDSIVRAQRESAMMAMAIANGNYRLTNTEILNAIFREKFPGKRDYRLESFKIKGYGVLAKPGLKQDRQSKVREARLAYHLTLNWRLVSPDASIWARDVSEQLIYRLRPDFDPHSVAAPWRLDLSAHQSEVPERTGETARYVLAMVGDVFPPPTLYQLKRGATAMQARRQLQARLTGDDDND